MGIMGYSAFWNDHLVGQTYYLLGPNADSIQVLRVSQLRGIFQYARRVFIQQIP